MKLPKELWSNPQEQELVMAIVDAFPDEAILLTDQLVNIIWVSTKAEDLFRQRGEAIVNRLTFSLLGMDDSANQRTLLTNALSGQTTPWCGMVNLENHGESFAEASALVGQNGHLCGIIRLGTSKKSCQTKN